MLSDIIIQPTTKEMKTLHFALEGMMGNIQMGTAGII